jgi:hypothetical protein
LNAGAIAGGVLGGFAAIIVILALGKCILTRRLHWKPNTLNSSRFQASVPPDSNMRMPSQPYEMESLQPYEMESGRAAWEMDASNSAVANS